VFFDLVVIYLSEFDDLISWLDKESRKPFIVKKGVSPKSNLLN